MLKSLAIIPKGKKKVAWNFCLDCANPTYDFKWTKILCTIVLHPNFDGVNGIWSHFSTSLTYVRTRPHGDVGDTLRLLWTTPFLVTVPSLIFDIFFSFFSHIALSIYASLYVECHITISFSILMTDMSNINTSKLKLVENRPWLTRANDILGRTITPFYH